MENKSTASNFGYYLMLSIPYRPVYGFITGDANCGLVLDKLVCWYYDLGMKEFCKSDAELGRETGLRVNMVRKAREKLVEKGFITVKEDSGVYCYKVDLGKIANAISQLKKYHEEVENEGG